MIAVLGTPGGGTKLASQLLKSEGLAVGHERLGKDGISCGFSAWAGIIPPGRWDFLPIERSAMPSEIASAIIEAISEDKAAHLFRPLRGFLSRTPAKLDEKRWGRFVREVVRFFGHVHGPWPRTLGWYWVLTHERLMVDDLPIVRADEHFLEDWARWRGVPVEAEMMEFSELSVEGLWELVRDQHLLDRAAAIEEIIAERVDNR